VRRLGFQGAKLPNPACISYYLLAVGSSPRLKIAITTRNDKTIMPTLNLDTTNKLNLQTQDLIGRCVAVLGISGSGKTNTAAVLVEELLASGVPMTIVDIEGEYWGLKEKHEVLVAGRSEHADVEFDAAHAGSLAELSVQRAIPIILDLSEYGQEEMYEFLLAYFTRLWEACFVHRQPYQVILEEAHEFLPQGQRTPLKEILTRIALRGRKRGLGTILMSQRSAKVDKDVLTQASLLFLHRVVHPIDLKVYQDIIPLPGREVESMVGGLQTGQTIALYQHQAQVVQVRLRHTFHAGATPLQETAGGQPELRRIDTALLDELRRLTAEKPTRQNGEETKLARRIAALEAELETRNLTISEQAEELKRLRASNSLLSKLKLSLDGMPTSTTAILSPTTLEVQEARIGKLVTNGATLGEKQSPSETRAGKTTKPNTSPPRPVAKVTAVPVIVQPEPANQGESVLLAQEEKRLDILIGKARKVPKTQLAILHLLAQTPQKAMDSRSISIALGINAAYLSVHPPLKLLSTNLVTRKKTKAGGYLYRSNLEEVAKVVLPRLTPSNVARLILERLG